MGATAVLLAGVAGFIVVRSVRERIQVRRLLRQLQQRPHPAYTAPRSATPGPIADEAGRAGARAHHMAHPLPWWPAALDAAWAGLDEIQALASIDPRVIEAMDFWLKADLSDFSTLQATVAEASASPNFEAWLASLKGYVGERIAADVLESQGATVELAPAPNQAGWDLLVDGKPYNVKVATDPEAIARHLEEYPDVGVITSPELAAHFPDHADQIMALPELSNAVVEEATRQTIEGIHELGWESSLPVVTLAFSGLRELQLLTQGKTDIPSSIRNVALDAAGTGAGGWVGGKLGVAIGSLAGPAGAVIGGIVGAVAGAIVGRRITNQIKMEPLRRAIALYDAERAAAQEEMQARWRQTQQATLDYIRAVEADLRRALDQLERAHRARAADAKGAFEQAVWAFVDSVPDALLQAAEQLRQRQREALQAMPPSPWWVRLVWPKAQDLQWRAVQVWFEAQQEVLRRAAARAQSIARRRGSASEAYEEVAGLLRDVRLRVPELTEALLRLEREYTRTLAILASERQRTRQEARAAVAEAASRIARFIDSQARQLDDWARQVGSRLHQLRQQVEREAARLGLS